MSKLRDVAYDAWRVDVHHYPCERYAFYAAWSAALEAAAKVCDAHGAMTRVAAMLRDPEFRWPGEAPQADDDPNDCHDWTPKGM